MRKVLQFSCFVFVVLGFGMEAGAQSSMKNDPMKKIEAAVETFAEGCKKELTTYCAAVRPGQGRILACLYAHSDKIGGRCEYALYDSAIQLDRAISGITYVAAQCRSDLLAHCGEVRLGKGRVVQCLKKNAAKLKPRCNAALKDVNLK